MTSVSYQLDGSFAELLPHEALAQLREHDGAVYGVWRDLRLAFVNPGWFRFATRNGGEPAISTAWGLGRSILDAMPPHAKAFYQARYRGCLASGEPWHHDYECSSATTYRRYHQIVYPLAGEGLLIVNSLVVERPHDPAERPAREPDESLYVDANGFVCQCAHCRRVKHAHHDERWDWVPEWVKRYPENTSHSFCPSCFAFHYLLEAPDRVS